MPNCGKPYDPFTRCYYSLQCGHERDCAHCPDYGSDNDLYANATDVLIAYVMASYREKIWTMLDPVFRDDADKSVIIVRALYGLKSAGASFRAYLAQFMKELGYASCDDEPDLWMKPKYRPEDNLECNTYILCHVDDIFTSIITQACIEQTEQLCAIETQLSWESQHVSRHKA